MTKKLIAIFFAAASVAYILNPTAGVFEGIPDNLPLVGNLDEAAAVAILIACLRYLGFDVTRFFKREDVIDVKPAED